MPMGCLELPHRMLRNQRKSLVVKQLKRCCCLAQPRSAGAACQQPSSGSSSSPEDAAAAAAATIGGGGGALCGCGSSGAWEPRALLGALLKHLDLDRLDSLSQAVQSRGLERTACVPLDDRDAVVVAGSEATAADMQRLCCAAWRWPDLSGAVELRPLPACARATAYIASSGGSLDCRTPQSHRSCCINPYHWSRVLSADVSSSDYDILRCDSGGFVGNVTSSSRTAASGFPAHASKSMSDAVGCHHSAETRTGSTATDGSVRSSWCQLAYWELRQRVGPLFPVYDNTIDVFHDTPEHGGSGGLSLLALRQQQQQLLHGSERGTFYECGDSVAAAASRERIARVRAKIGLGITLYREQDSEVAAADHRDDAKRPRSGGGSSSIWLYNRSELPVFVSSCLLGSSAAGGDVGSAPPRLRGWPAHRLPPGYCVRVYDREAIARATHALRCNATASDRGEDGPVDFHSIHVSFAKGWGAGYSRQAVTSCACWLEILVDANR